MLLGHPEPVALVERDVAFLGGLQVDPPTFSVTALQDRSDDRRTCAMSLPRGLGTEHLEVPVGLLGMVAGEVGEALSAGGHPEADEAGRDKAKAGGGTPHP